MANPRSVRHVLEMIGRKAPRLSQDAEEAAAWEAYRAAQLEDAEELVARGAESRAAANTPNAYDNMLKAHNPNVMDITDGKISRDAERWVGRERRTEALKQKLYEELHKMYPEAGDFVVPDNVSDIRKMIGELDKRNPYQGDDIDPGDLDDAIRLFELKGSGKLRHPKSP